MEEQWFDITTAAEQPEAAEALLSSCTEHKNQVDRGPNISETSPRRPAAEVPAENGFKSFDFW